MTNYTYKDKKTGKKVFSDRPIKDPKLVLVCQVRNGQMNSNKTVKK